MRRAGRHGCRVLRSFATLRSPLLIPLFVIGPPYRVLVVRGYLTSARGALTLRISRSAFLEVSTSSVDYTEVVLEYHH